MLNNNSNKITTTTTTKTQNNCIVTFCDYPNLKIFLESRFTFEGVSSISDCFSFVCGNQKWIGTAGQSTKPKQSRIWLVQIIGIIFRGLMEWSYDTSGIISTSERWKLAWSRIMAAYNNWKNQVFLTIFRDKIT